MGDLHFGGIGGNVGGDVNQAKSIHKGDVVKGDKVTAAEGGTIVIHSDGTASAVSGEAPTNLGPIFVSHAHADATVVGSLLELLVKGLTVGEGDILATSLLGKEIPAGVMWADYLKDRLTDTRLVVMVLTPNFLKSEFCLIELGALWALEKPVLPIVVPPLSKRDLGHILNNMQCLDAHKDTDLLRARAEVAKVLNQTVPDIDLTDLTATFNAALPASDGVP